jgi:hypothetical protein
MLYFATSGFVHLDLQYPLFIRVIHPAFAGYSRFSGQNPGHPQNPLYPGIAAQYRVHLQIGQRINHYLAAM